MIFIFKENGIISEVIANDNWCITEHSFNISNLTLIPKQGKSYSDIKKYIEKNLIAKNQTIDLGEYAERYKEEDAR